MAEEPRSVHNVRVLAAPIAVQAVAIRTLTRLMLDNNDGFVIRFTHGSDGDGGSFIGLVFLLGFFALAMVFIRLSKTFFTSVNVLN